MYINDKSNTLKKVNYIYSPESWTKLAYLVLDNNIPRTITVGKDIPNSINGTKTNLTFENAVYISGGFMVEQKYRGKGLGERILKQLFKIYPDIDNILFYSNEPRAINFWKKLGSEEVLSDRGLILFNLNRNKIINESMISLKTLLLESFHIYEVKVILKTRKDVEQNLTTIYDKIRAVPYVVVLHSLKDEYVSARSDKDHEYAQVNMKFSVPNGDIEGQLEKIKALSLRGEEATREFKVNGLIAFVPRMRTLKRMK